MTYFSIRHEGPVWQLSWAHPKFGCVLASCSYDRKVNIWKQTAKNQWTVIYTYEGHELSGILTKKKNLSQLRKKKKVNSVEFGPHEFGLNLAAGSSDGTISIISFKGIENILFFFS